MFMLIIWLQGIWLPLHGVDYADTPLRAGIYMLPLTVGMLIAGPTSGYLSDRFGARLFATGGMLAAALSFVLLSLLPIDFSFPEFAAVLFLMGVSMGMFASPNRAAVMNSLPPQHRGAGGGMNQTFQNSAQVLSVGIFFTLMILGLASSLPHTLTSGLKAHGISAATASSVAHVPPVSVLFAAFLGYNPVETLVGSHALARCLGRQPRRAHGSGILSTADLRAVQHGPARGVRVRGPRLPDRRGRIADAGRQVSLCGPCRDTRRRSGTDNGERASASHQRDGAEPARHHNHPDHNQGGAACKLSGTASRRFVSLARDRRWRSTRSGTCRRSPRAAGCSSTTRRSRAWRRSCCWSPTSTLTTTAWRSIGGDPAILRSTAGKLESPIGEVMAIASEHDESAGTERGPNTIFVFELDGVRVCHFGDFGQSRCAPSRPARSARSIC